MNPRRVHSLMKAGFPAYDAVALDWAILARAANCPPIEVQRFLEAAFASEQVLVEVNRFTGGLFSLAEAAAFAAPYVGRETVRFADRGFTSFAVIASAGVAASWVKCVFRLIVTVDFGIVTAHFG